MDYDMQHDSQGPSRSRKRSSAWISEDAVDINDDETPEPDYNPSKRQVNSRGEAIQTNRVTRYDAQKLLNHLAFTRVYVTANFHNYNPNKSFIILCMVSEQDEMYRSLCRILPSLYAASPLLQALAIADGYLNPNSMSDQALLRILPLVTTATMEVLVAEEFQAFRMELGAYESCVALISPRGLCTWNSADSASNTPSLGIEMIRKALEDAGTVPETGDVNMEDG